VGLSLSATKTRVASITGFAGIGYAIGDMGILVRAYRGGLLSFDQTGLLIREIAARPDIWIASRLCAQVLASLSS